jgi:hypothetical protein
MLFLSVLVMAFSLFATAADVTGKWTAEVPGRQGATQQTTFDFKVDGSKLTGTVSTQRGQLDIQDGKVEGDNLSFVIVLNFQGNEIRLLYKGKVSGDEIQFTRGREGGQRTQEFTAKRAK